MNIRYYFSIGLIFLFIVKTPLKSVPSHLNDTECSRAQEIGIGRTGRGDSVMSKPVTRLTHYHPKKKQKVQIRVYKRRVSRKRMVELNRHMKGIDDKQCNCTNNKRIGNLTEP